MRKFVEMKEVRILLVQATTVLAYTVLADKLSETSKTTFNNDQPRSGKEKDLWLETIHET